MSSFEMHELWSTIVAPLLDARRPALILDVGGEDIRIARLCAHHARSWGGRVLSLQPQVWDGTQENLSDSTHENLSIQAHGDLSSLSTMPRPDLALLHGCNPWSLPSILDGLAEASFRAELPSPTILVHGVAQDQISRAAAERTLRVISVPGLGGIAILSSDECREQEDLGRVLDELLPTRLIEAQLTLLEAQRLAQADRAKQAEMRASTAAECGFDQEVLLAELRELRERLTELLSHPPKRASRTIEAPYEEPSQASVRELLKPSRLLAELNVSGAEQELALPIPSDHTPLLDRDAAPTQPVRAVAYLLPGLPPEGSGGSHSLVQEARGLRALGCEARVCVPSSALEAACALYGNNDELFAAYVDASDIVEAVGPAEVAIATEHPSMSMLEVLVRSRPQIACAYYVQDYEPLFAPPGSRRSDRALLSYRAIPELRLFAKTHWLCNVVCALHGISVAKVEPSLDRKIFNAEDRGAEQRTVRIAAMVRPRTPRRRPSATLEVLARIRAELPERVRTHTFGCDASAYSQLVGGDESGDHLGLLSRNGVAELMRRCDIFIDASAYQAFGRSGLEAMACGAVPVLPALGGVYEYARRDENSLIFEDDRPAAIAESVLALARDPVRLERLRKAGLHDAAHFSVERAAQSQLELFSMLAARRRNSARVLA